VPVFQLLNVQKMFFFVFHLLGQHTAPVKVKFAMELSSVINKLLLHVLEIILELCSLLP